MHRKRAPLKLVFLFSVLFIFACVTINIYFPAEKVESVADKIVHEIRGKTPPQGAPAKTGGKHSGIEKALQIFSTAVAQAAEVTDVSNPTIRALKKRMRRRYAQMKPYYTKGLFKEGDDGYVALGNAGGLNLKTRRLLNALAEAENKDRRTLYSEVAKALKISPDQVDKVATIFAKQWQQSVR